MPKPLSPESMAIIKSTAPAFRQHGLAITTRMYERLLVDPEINAMFDPRRAKIGRAAETPIGAILAFAENVERLEVLTPTLERMAACHLETKVRPEHYPAVANVLLLVIKDVLGDTGTRRCSAPGTKLIGSSSTS